MITNCFKWLTKPVATISVGGMAFLIGDGLIESAIHKSSVEKLSMENTMLKAEIARRNAVDIEMAQLKEKLKKEGRL